LTLTRNASVVIDFILGLVLLAGCHSADAADVDDHPGP
jgi:hypothetical protein